MAARRGWILRLVAGAGVLAGLAACDAPARLAGPAAPHAAVAADSTATPTATTDAAGDPLITCRSGYQIAYRSDGTAYCAPE